MLLKKCGTAIVEDTASIPNKCDCKYDVIKCGYKPNTLKLFNSRRATTGWKVLGLDRAVAAVGGDGHGLHEHGQQLVLDALVHLAAVLLHHGGERHGVLLRPPQGRVPAVAGAGGASAASSPDSFSTCLSAISWWSSNSACAVATSDSGAAAFNVRSSPPNMW